MKTNTFPLSACLVLVLTALLVPGCGAPEIGLDKTGLRPCPSSPNCVVSMGGDADHSVAPIVYESDRGTAVARMRSVVSAMPGARIVSGTPGYLHAEFRSQIMRFVDDVEFWFPEGEKIIHIRSAARVGYSDFGVNRDRAEEIRALFQKAPAARD